MTTKQIQQAGGMRPDGQYPDFPPRDDMNNPIYLYVPGYLSTLPGHFGSQDSILVPAEVPLGWAPRATVGIPDTGPDDRLRGEPTRAVEP